MSTRLLISLLAVSLSATAWADTCAVPSEQLADRLIVRSLPGSELAAFLAVFESHHPGVAVTPVDSVQGRGIHLLELQTPPDYTLADFLAVADDLDSSHGAFLDWGEFLYTNEAPEGTTGSTFVDHPASGLYKNQYATTVTGTTAAHARSTGTGNVVAVLDTGVDLDHPALAGRGLPYGWDFMDNDSDPGDTGDTIDNDGDGLVDEMTGHGTFVAGLVALVAPEAWILPIRVLDSDGNGDMWVLARGLFYAIDHGVEVINVSITSTYNSEAIEVALVEAGAVGIVVVAAAGNCDRAEPRTFPAMRSEAIGVAATDAGDVKGVFSNFSDRLALSAPGVTTRLGDIPNPNGAIVSLLPGGGYAIWEGTSMAAPIVSGAVALVRAQHPEWAATEAVRLAITARLTATAVNIDGLNPGYEGQLGSGRIDIAAAVELGPIAPARGDLNADGAINVLDLIQMMTDMGLTHSSADLNGDGTVDSRDVADLLLLWGAP